MWTVLFLWNHAMPHKEFVDGKLEVIIRLFFGPLENEIFGITKDENSIIKIS